MIAVASCPECMESWTISWEDAEAAGNVYPIEQPVEAVREHMTEVPVHAGPFPVEVME